VLFPTVSIAGAQGTSEHMESDMDETMVRLRFKKSVSWSGGTRWYNPNDVFDVPRSEAHDFIAAGWAEAAPSAPIGRAPQPCPTCGRPYDLAAEAAAGRR
jgi:hypothetical protein